jgi:hypothetical protein
MAMPNKRARWVSAARRHRAHHGGRLHRNLTAPGRSAHGQTAHGGDSDVVFLAYRKRRLGHESGPGSQDREIFADRRQNAGICRRGSSKTSQRDRDEHAHRPPRSRPARGPCLHFRPDRRRRESVEDYYPSGKRFLLRFKEKGGKEKELPVHHKLEELLDQYLKASGLEKEPQSLLFPASIGKTGKLSRRPLVRTDAADMLKRRLKQAGLPAHYSPHSFRATGITNFLENDGTLEAAQRIAGHADSRTTKLYDRRGQKVLLEDMERIRY